MVDSDEDGGVNAEAMATTQVDIKEYDNSYAFDIDMPGVKFGDIRVQVKSNNVLFMSSKRRRLVEEGAKYIQMERPERNFMRKFALPENANTDKITAVSRDGVLTVTVEKMAPPQPPPVEVKEKEEALSSCKDGCKVDRISMLPDELLVSVLSLLSFKEVCCASILSRRWRYLHTLMPKLDFDGRRSLRKMEGDPRYVGDPVVVQEKEREYIESVGRSVHLHRSSPLSEFRVVFTLTKSHTQLLDEWVEFALSKKVESLDLHLIGQGGDIPEDGCYAFPCKYLKLANSNLKKVSTYFVNVSGEGVEMILGNCPVLEQLSIGQSSDLTSLEISKPSPSFRMLEILMCWNLKLVVVRDSNITRVKYIGPAVKFELENVGLLREIWVGGSCTGSLEDVVEMFSTQLLPHLHIFKLGLSRIALADILCSNFREAVVMTSLKELVVDIMICHHDEDPLLPFIHLIKASPNLQRFVIVAPRYKAQVNNPMSREIPRVKRERPRAYPYLKEVEFVGYRGLNTQFEILKHLMENAIALESITIDTRGFKELYEISWDQIPRRKFNPHVFAKANALKQCAPFGINVYIL